MSSQKDNISEKGKEEKQSENKIEIKTIINKEYKSEKEPNYSEMEIEEIENIKNSNINNSPNIVTKTEQHEQIITHKISPTVYTTHTTTVISNPPKKKEKIIKQIEYKTTVGNNQNIEGFPFVKDKLKEIFGESNKDQGNKNIIIEKSHQIITNNIKDSNNDKINSNNNGQKEVYKRSIIKGNIYNKKNNLKNNNENINQEIITKTEKIIINSPQNIITKQHYYIEKGDDNKNDNKIENKNDNFQIEKKISYDNNNIDIFNSINSNSFLDNSSQKFDYSDMSENRVRRFKSFYSHHSFSTDKIDDLLSSIDFKVKRTKTLKGHKISEFSEHDEIEEDDEKNEYTIVKHITNKIPILKDNEFEQLKIEIKPIIDKYENNYNEYINKQDSKEETQIKKEIITTTKTEKKIINLGGKSGDELSISNSFNNNSININDSINNNNENNIKNEDIKKKLFEENDNINIMNYDRKNKEDLWRFFSKKLIIQYNQRYKEFRKIVINALKKKYEKKINILLNLSNKKENANSNKGEIIKENILNLKINENI